MKLYAKVRKYSAWIQPVLGILALVVYIIINCITSDGGNWQYILGGLVVTCLLGGIDVHWSNVIMFHANHPYKEKGPI